MKLIPLLAIFLLIFLLRKPLRKILSRLNFPKKTWIKWGLLALLFLSLLLVVTGRLHWLGALVTGLLVVARQVLPLVLSHLPQLFSIFSKHKTNSSEGKQPPSPNQQGISIEEAFSILGLEESASEKEIINAHRKLMSKLHPDKGGNDYLATQLNLAKDVLLKYKKHKQKNHSL